MTSSISIIDDAVNSAIADADKLQRAAGVYAALGASVCNSMRSKKLSRVRVALATISKAMKSKGASNFELRRLDDTASQQFVLMAKVISTYGIGAIPHSDSLVFVSLEDVPTLKTIN